MRKPDTKLYHIFLILIIMVIMFKNLSDNPDESFNSNEYSFCIKGQLAYVNHDGIVTMLRTEEGKAIACFN